MNILSFNESYQEFKPFLSLVLFCSGCNLNCYHCFNYDFVTDKTIEGVDSLDIISNNVLQNPMIKSITFLGGEPTIWNNKLIDSLRFCKVNNLKTKLYTNGTNPYLLEKIFEEELLDSISLDIKTISNNNIINKDSNSNIMNCYDYLKLVESSLNISLSYGIIPLLRCVDLIHNNTQEVISFLNSKYPQLDLIISPDLYYKMK